MSKVTRSVFVTVIALLMLLTLAPQASCLWRTCPSNGLSVDYDGVVTGVQDGSPASRESIEPGDRVVPPLPRELFRQPPELLHFKLSHNGAIRGIALSPTPSSLTRTEKLRLSALIFSYLIFLLVGTGVLLLRPSAMTWAFYLYCVLRRYGDLHFYWPGSSAVFWTGALLLISLGGATCALVTLFALRFPNNRLDGWRGPLNRIALLLAFLFPVAWLYVFARIVVWGWPSQAIVMLFVQLTSIVYLAAAAIFVVTLIKSRGEERQRLRWILVFPLVIVLRIAALNLPESAAPWFNDMLIALAVLIPLSVAYAVVRRRVFDVEFVISRALVYAAITSIVAGLFLLLDWFMSKQFAQTRFTLTAEIILALAIGSWLNMLHRNVDRLVDSTFFRQRHLAQERLAKAAAAVLRAESHVVVDRFLVHEPIRALDLASSAIFHRDDATGHFTREVVVGWEHVATRELTSDDPLVLHLLAEEEPVRLADVVWPSETSPTHVGDSVLAMPVLLRDQLVAIVLYGPHRNGTDIDPDEVRSIALLVERAGAAYDHIEARTLRAQVETLIRERDAKQREIEILRASTA